MRRIAVTGANGYIGRRLVALLPSNRLVRLCRNNVSGLRGDWIEFDLSKPAPSLPHDIGAVIHLAADLNFQISAEQELSAIRGLLIATRAVGARFLFVSSQSAAAPIGEYGARKAAAEAVVRAHGGVVVRPGLVVGGRTPKGLAALVVALSRMPVLPDLGSLAHVQPIHVDNVARALCDLAASQTVATDLVELAGSKISLKALIIALARGAGRHEPLFFPVPHFITKMIAWNARSGWRGSLRQMLMLSSFAAERVSTYGVECFPISFAGLVSNSPVRRSLINEARRELARVGIVNPRLSAIRCYVHYFEKRMHSTMPDILCVSGETAALRRRTLALSILDSSVDGARALMIFERRLWLGVFCSLSVTAVFIAVERLFCLFRGNSERR